MVTIKNHQVVAAFKFYSTNIQHREKNIEDRGMLIKLKWLGMQG